jgi:hypothetical protein
MRSGDTGDTTSRAPRDWVYPGQPDLPEDLVVDEDSLPDRARKHRPKH